MAKETFSRKKPDTRPPPPPPVGFKEVDITNTAGLLSVFTLTFSEQPDTDFYAVIYCTMWTGAGTMRPKSSSFRILAAAQIPVTPFEIDIKDKYLARFGQPEVGNKIFTKVIIVDSVSGSLYKKGTISAIVTGT